MENFNKLKRRRFPLHVKITRRKWKTADFWISPFVYNLNVFATLTRRWKLTFCTKPVRLHQREAQPFPRLPPFPSPIPPHFSRRDITRRKAKQNKTRPQSPPPNKYPSSVFAECFNTPESSSAIFTQSKAFDKPLLSPSLSRHYTVEEPVERHKITGNQLRSTEHLLCSS